MGGLVKKVTKTLTKETLNQGSCLQNHRSTQSSRPSPKMRNVACNRSNFAFQAYKKLENPSGIIQPPPASSPMMPKTKRRPRRRAPPHRRATRRNLQHGGVFPFLALAIPALVAAGKAAALKGVGAAAGFEVKKFCKWLHASGVEYKKAKNVVHIDQYRRCEPLQLAKADQINAISKLVMTRQNKKKKTKKNKKDKALSSNQGARKIPIS